MTGYIEIEGSIVQDFAQRTLENLEFIETQVDEYRNKRSMVQVFEVTQLINSLLGLLVFPKEEFYQQRLQSIDIRSLGWVKIIQDTDFPQFTDLGDLIKKLRNSVSHFHIASDVDRVDELDYLYFWDTNPHNGNQNWGGQISVADLREFVKRFAEGIVNGSLLK